VPDLLVMGDKEMEAGAVALRLRSGEDLGAISVDAFIARAQSDIVKGD
jgi:threonyl-tRNA synthetase